MAHSSVLTLYRFRSSTGKLEKLFEQDTFSSIRCLTVFKVSGSTKDCIVVTSDSGNLTILTVNARNDLFEPMHNEPFAKTGITRLTPGEYMSVDDKGRALMLSAIEKNKLVYVANMEPETNKIMISSPLEANKSKSLTFFTCGLDVGYENPVFASIESDYSDNQRKNGEFVKNLTYYELDLGLNHVVRKYTEKIDNSANFLLPIPGGLDGPSGLLICLKNVIYYKYLNGKSYIVPIPKRYGNSDTDSYIINGVVNKMKGYFFVLLQNSVGDLFKVTLKYEEDTVENPGEIESMEIKYFDTLPIMKSLLIFKSGFLFADSEHGDKYIYQFEKLGDDADKVWKSTNYTDFIDASSEENIQFDIKGLDNLGLVDIVSSLNPLTYSKVLSSRDGSSLPKISGICGSGARSTLKLLSREVPISELVSTDLPADAQKVFTTKVFETDEFDRYLVLSFIDGTLVLSIGESVEEVTNSGLDTTLPTLLVQQMGQNSVVQVQSDSLRNLTYSSTDEEPKVKEWLPPAGIKILSASATKNQLAVGLSNRDLVVFDHQGEELIEHKERPEMLGLISSIALEQTGPERLRSRYIAIGTTENTIHILSMNQDSMLEELAVQLLSSTPVSLQMMSMIENARVEKSRQISSLYLHIGMRDGIYARIGLDTRTGGFGDVRSAVVGSKAVTLSTVTLFEQNMIMCFSSKTYIGFSSDSDFTLIPVSQSALTSGYGFKQEDCPENGMVGVYSNKLTIFSAESVSNEFQLETVDLRYTPRRFVEHEGRAYVIECDYNIRSPLSEQLVGKDEVEFEASENDGMFQQFGYEVAKDQWGSCIQTVDVASREVIQSLEIGNNDSVISVVVARFNNVDHLVVGCSRDQTLLPNSCKAHYLRVYEISGKGLQFKHSTKVQGQPLAMAPFRDMLLVGTGDSLTLYDLGLKQLLRKAMFKSDCKQIVQIETFDNRIAIADIQQSITFVIYKPNFERFIAFATDFISRGVSTFKFVDYDTVVGGDRYGQVFILRCPEDISRLSDEDDHGTYLSSKDEFLNGCPYRLNNLLNYYVGDVITSITKSRLSINEAGPETIVYTGLQGTVGVLLPLIHDSEISFFVKFQRLMREESVSITERDHLKYRSYYIPVKNVIDGDLIDQFAKMSSEKRLKIAGKLDTTVRHIEKRISDTKSRVYF